MNKVYISGTIADAPSFNQSEGGAAHLAFQLCVRHKTAKGAMKRELYRVNSWNNAALWGKANLRVGQNLVVEGYLTQRIVETGVICVEVTAEQFLTGTVAAQGSRLAQVERFQSDAHEVSSSENESHMTDIASKRTVDPISRMKCALRE